MQLGIVGNVQIWIKNGPMIFIIYINYINGFNNFIEKSTDDTKTGNAIISNHNGQSLQGDMHKISVWFNRWEIPFNVDKCLSGKNKNKTKNMSMKCAASNWKLYKVSNIVVFRLC